MVASSPWYLSSTLAHSIEYTLHAVGKLATGKENLNIVSIRCFAVDTSFISALCAMRNMVFAIAQEPLSTYTAPNTRGPYAKYR